jgi:hypothetical protein
LSWLTRRLIPTAAHELTQGVDKGPNGRSGAVIKIVAEGFSLCSIHPVLMEQRD